MLAKKEEEESVLKSAIETLVNTTGDIKLGLYEVSLTLTLTISLTLIITITIPICMTISITLSTSAFMR